MTTTNIPDCHTASKQEIYDFIVAHLRKQGHPAKAMVNGAVHCAYRTENHESCAVGCLIPDEMYHPIIEGVGIGCIIDITSYFFVKEKNIAIEEFFKKLGFERHLSLLMDMQDAHDNWKGSLKNIEKTFQNVANSNGLHYTPPA